MSNMGQAEDAEITLGTGKLLAMFFALVVICAIFFGLGYSLGRSGAKPAEAAVDPATAPAAAATSSGLKPSAVKAGATAPADNSELTFYKSVEQNQPDPQLPATASAASSPAPSNPAPASAPLELTKPAPGAIVVQVAAVSKQEDAEILMKALQKKQYPVFVTPVDGDKLFHVQVGPFVDQKEAENMKTKLTGDGYSPILKRQ